MAYQGSTIQVNGIEGIDGAPVTLGFGATVPSGAYLTIQGNLSVSGVITANSFAGDASALTGMSVASTSFTIAYNYLGI